MVYDAREKKPSVKRSSKRSSTSSLNKKKTPSSSSSKASEKVKKVDLPVFSRNLIVY